MMSKLDNTNLATVVARTPSGTTCNFPENTTSITFNIPVTGVDSNQHIYSFQVDGEEILNIHSSGDGAGGTTQKEIIFTGSAIFYGDFVVSAAAGGTGSIYAVNVSHNGRHNHTAVYNIAAANDLTLLASNFARIQGNTTINGIETTGWYPGDVISLQFLGTPTVKNNTAASSGFASLKLDGAADFAATTNDMLVLQLNYDSTYWHEISRTVLT